MALRATCPVEWRQLCQERYQTEKQVVHLLELAISKGIRFYLVDEDDMEGFGRLVGEEGDSNCSPGMVDFILRDILSKGLRLVNDNCHSLRTE